MIGASRLMLYHQLGIELHANIGLIVDAQYYANLL
jgi:hypothetical protein